LIYLADWYAVESPTLSARKNELNQQLISLYR